MSRLRHVTIRHTARTLTAVAVIGALTLGACGGDDDAPSSDDAGTTTTEITEPATTEPATTEPATTEPATTEPATTEPAPPAPEGDTITIADFAFDGVTEVAVGTTVVVTNTDATPHTWSAEDGTFDSGALAPGATFEFTFTEAGEFAYFCNFHPSMTGTIAVVG